MKHGFISTKNEQKLIATKYLYLKLKTIELFINMLSVFYELLTITDSYSGTVTW